MEDCVDKRKNAQVLLFRWPNHPRYKKAIYSWKPLTIFANRYIFDVWLGSEYAAGISCTTHCVRSAPSRSFSGPYFPVFRLNTERYTVCGKLMQSEWGKTQTRLTPDTDTFYAGTFNIKEKLFLRKREYLLQYLTQFLKTLKLKFLNE